MEKIWFITGVSSGLGAALARAVINDGGVVAGTFRKKDQADRFTQENKGRGLGLVMDVTRPEQIKQAIEQVLSQKGRIDVLVNNAGYGTLGALEEFSMEEIRKQMETNFFGAVAVTKEVLPHMRQQKQGHIVQISSQSGFRATAGFGLYNSSKFALEGFSEALAQEVSSFGIRVVIVEPGPFRTEFLAGSMQVAEKRIAEYEQTGVAQMHQYMKNMNGKQEGDPEKAAQAILNYVKENKPNLRLPLGKSAVQGMRTKLETVEKDIKANEDIANNAVFG